MTHFCGGEIVTGFIQESRTWRAKCQRCGETRTSEESESDAVDRLAETTPEDVTP